MAIISQVAVIREDRIRMRVWDILNPVHVDPIESWSKPVRPVQLKDTLETKFEAR